MVRFLITYSNMDDGTERTWCVVFDEVGNTLQDNYIAAVKIAFNNKRYNELVGNIEFISWE